MLSVRYTPWAGSPGVIATVNLGPLPIVGSQDVVLNVVAGAVPSNNIVGAQSVGIDISAAAYAPIVGSQSVALDIVAAAASVNALSPLTIAPGWSVFLVGDVGLTGGGASPLTWADQSGNAKDATQASAGFIPTVGALLNGRTGITLDGTNDFLAFASLDLDAPGTTPSWIFSVWRWKSFTTGDNMYAGGSTSIMRLLQNTGANIQKHNGTLSGALTPASNTWQCSEDYYANSAADYLRIGASSTTPAVAGNGNPASAAFRIGSSNGAGLGAPDADMMCFGILPRLPTPTEISNLRAWVTAWYGGTVAV